jgi:hypothetical protein
MTGRHEAGRSQPDDHGGDREGEHAAAGQRGGGVPVTGTGRSDGAGPNAVGAAGADGERQTGFGFRILPAGWMRGLLFTVTAVLTVVIALSDLTSAWVLLVLPLAVVIAVAYLEALDRITRP